MNERAQACAGSSLAPVDASLGLNDRREILVRRGR
jgi:hypothetical protein